MQKYCKCGQNRGCTSAVYAAFKMILIRAFQRHIVCGIIWIICKVIAYSLKGMLKLCLHKYCICATNRGCSSAVYAASRIILIRAFQRDIICGIRCIICKVIAYSLKGMLKLHLHKYWPWQRIPCVGWSRPFSGQSVCMLWQCMPTRCSLRRPVTLSQTM